MKRVVNCSANIVINFSFVGNSSAVVNFSAVNECGIKRVVNCGANIIFNYCADIVVNYCIIHNVNFSIVVNRAIVCKY